MFVILLFHVSNRWNWNRGFGTELEQRIGTEFQFFNDWERWGPSQNLFLSDAIML